jgi:formylglycine-generating enzyme required for sulfatase activity
MNTLSGIASVVFQGTMDGIVMSLPSPTLVPPRIPDHEVLRCIGRGSYGEVWMARAVTGVLRAVKVVRRADFEMERTFEREFEGIRSFEPISRSHPGLIDILHVGRNADEGFYFCVMELADDRYCGRAIVPAEYEARTLGTDKKDSAKLGLDTVIEVGLLLADALAHLHQHGLIHRDVKPSNVIFIDGVAQLADIGLVAAYGQRTYVGTEGFVAPEGPGTPQADTYSLGMVLYELSTGRDRLEFPALPDDMARVGDRKKWRALNEVICRACAPDPKDRYPDAHDMAGDLRRVLNGGRKRSRGMFRRKRFWLGAAAALGLLAWSDQEQKKKALGLGLTGSGPAVAGVSPPRPDDFPFVGPPLPPPPQLGRLRLTTDPPGAEVWIKGENRGVTPMEVADLPVGTVPVTLRLPQYREMTRIANIVENQASELATPLEFWNPPQPGQPWRNSLGLEFQPRGSEHVAVLPTTRECFIQAHDGQFREGEVLPWTPPGASDTSFIVFVPRRDAEAYRTWIEDTDKARGFFGMDHFYRIEEVGEGISPTRDDTTRDHLSFRLVAGLRQFGAVVVTSSPAGADVIENGEKLGVTPLTLPRRLVGPVSFELRLSGHHPRLVEGEVAPSSRLEMQAKLERSLLAVFDQEWQNGLGQIFRPVQGLQFCIWETRVRDYDVFLAATQRPHTTDLDQAPDHPVIGVDRADAQAFCRWLTGKEAAEGRLENGWKYRLPTDGEWSLAAGIPNERGTTPMERNSRIRGVYPWGYVWPPPPRSGNFADQSAVGKVVLERPADRLLPGSDAFTFTSPVGIFAPSASGLHDLAGNVWEWVAEDFGGGTAVSNYSEYGVVRGGSWADYSKDRFLSSFRNAVPVAQRESNIGFRIVLAAGAQNKPAAE